MSVQPIARFKELCLDVVEADVETMNRMSRFWADVSGGRAVAAHEGELADVVGDRESRGISICPVPEAKTVKHRVHLDVYAHSVADVVAMGATTLVTAEESGAGWSVLADPEGGEFCVFVRDELPDFRVHGIVVDAVDPESICRWWARVFGVEPQAEVAGEQRWWSLEGATGETLPTFDFVPVPEPKTVKNRIHWDVYGEVDALVAAGAQVLAEQPRWTVLADPEGNEFCVFAG